jgi:hypothetical protein
MKRNDGSGGGKGELKAGIVEIQGAKSEKQESGNGQPVDSRDFEA